MSKTKEELEDIKIFAEFINYHIEPINYFDEDTKQQVIRSYIDDLYNHFEPQNDWNLIMKAVSKSRDLFFNSNTYNELDKYLDEIDDCLLSKDKLSQYREIIYGYLVLFIKGYNQINSNTNNNNS